MERIERTALRNLIHNEEYSRKVLPFIKEDYFSDRLERLLFKEIYRFITKFNALPTKEALSIEINDSKDITEDILQKLDDAAKKEFKYGEEQIPETTSDE